MDLAEKLVILTRSGLTTDAAAVVLGLTSDEAHAELGNPELPDPPSSGGGGGVFTLGPTVNRFEDWNGNDALNVGDDPVYVTAMFRLIGPVEDPDLCSADLETYSSPDGGVPLDVYAMLQMRNGDGQITVPVSGFVPAGGSYFFNLNNAELTDLVEQPITSAPSGGGGGDGLVSFVLTRPDGVVPSWDGTADLDMPLVGSVAVSLDAPSLISVGLTAAVRRVDDGPWEQPPSALLRLVRDDEDVDFLQGIGGTFGPGIPSSYPGNNVDHVYFGNEAGPGYIIAPFMVPSGDYTFEFRLGAFDSDPSDYEGTDTAAMVVVLATA